MSRNGLVFLWLCVVFPAVMVAAWLVHWPRAEDTMSILIAIAVWLGPPVIFCFLRYFRYLGKNPGNGLLFLVMGVVGGYYSLDWLMGAHQVRWTFNQILLEKVFQGDILFGGIVAISLFLVFVGRLLVVGLAEETK